MRSSRRARLLITLMVAAFSTSNTHRAILRKSIQRTSPTKIERATRDQIFKTYEELPMSFEANQGQTDGRVKFLSRGHGYTLFLTSTEAVLTLDALGDSGARPGKSSAGIAQHFSMSRPIEAPSRGRSVLRMRVVGADRKTEVMGIGDLPGRSNYFIGSDSQKWRTNITTFAKVRYKNVYPGVDLVYYGKQGKLEYDFVLAPGADPKVIRLAIEGADKLEVNTQGDLEVNAAGGTVRLRRPSVYQENNGVSKEIPAGYALKNRQQVCFYVGDYDAARPLVIDPILEYSSYLGGSTGGDEASGIAIDSLGNAYLIGSTVSMDFPTSGSSAFQTTCRSCPSFPSVFVTKLNLTGSSTIYSTFIGGRSVNYGSGIAVDSLGSAYLFGDTFSSDFPATPGSFQTTKPAGSAGFVTKLNPSGTALVYSTFLGTINSARGIAVDASGNAYVVGNANDFPTTPGVFQPTKAGANAFVAKLNATGTGLVYASFLGGTVLDFANAVAVDFAGNAYVAGVTSSPDYPTTPGAFQTTYGGTGSCCLGIGDGFVAKVSPDASKLVYSTFLGGRQGDMALGIAVDRSGSAYVTGETFSSNFPATPGALQPSLGGSGDAFVAKLNLDGSGLAYSTYLGGTGQDAGNDIAVDSSGNAYVVGFANSEDFPARNSVQKANAGLEDAFVAKLNSSGSDLIFSTYWGGTGRDYAVGIALDSMGNSYVTGHTNSEDFPTTPGAFRVVAPGGTDAFVAKFDRHATSVFYPRLISSANEFTGIAVANLDTGETSLRFTAYDTNGALISGAGITNPATATLKPGQQIPVVDYQVWGSGITVKGPLGWFRIDSTLGKVAGLFLAFNDRLSFLDGADVSGNTLATSILPEIEGAEGITQIHVANPNPAPARVTFDLYKSDGNPRVSSVVRDIKPNGVLADLLTNLFPGVAAAASDYLRVTSTRGVVSFEYFGKGEDFAGLNGQDVTAGGTRLYSPQYAVGGGDWLTKLSVVNLTPDPARVAFKLVSDDGTQIASRIIEIEGRGKIYITDQAFFVNPGDNLVQGYVEITSSGPRLAGSVFFGDQTQKRSATALPLVSLLLNKTVFGQVASDSNYFTGIAMVNPNDTNANATVEVFDLSGRPVASRVVGITPRGRRSDLLTGYFSDLAGQNLRGGYIRVTADQRLAGFALFGTNNLSVLSAIPPQVVP